MSAKCTICNAGDSRSCAHCKSSYYCSLECQQTDWPAHKLLCKTFNTIAPRPGPSFKLAVLFPSDQISPKLIWVGCERKEVSHLLGNDDPFLERKPMTRNIFRGFGLECTLEVICRETFLVDGSETNQSVIQVTRGAMGHDWRGPIVVFRQPEARIGSLVSGDMTLADFRHAVDYFLSYGNEPTQNPWNSTIRSGSKILGVKVTCVGDQKAFGAEHYMAVGVPRDHPVFLSSEPTGISSLVELPVLVRKYPPDPVWKNDRDTYGFPFENRAATFLHLNADPKSEDWGWAPLPEWQNDVGSILVVRQDGKDLTTHQAEVLCHYCHFKLQPLFEDSMGGGRVERTREEVMGYMNRETFAAFFEEYREERVKEDPSWAVAKSPYADE